MTEEAQLKSMILRLMVRYPDPLKDESEAICDVWERILEEIANEMDATSNRSTDNGFP